jgi:hypothetical protein
MVIDKPRKDTFSKNADWPGAFPVRAECQDLRRKLRLLRKTPWQRKLCGDPSLRKKSQRPRLEGLSAPAAVIPARVVAVPCGLGERVAGR